MQIDPRTREYLLWTVRNAPLTAVFDVSFNEGTDWHPLELDGDTLRILIAGPLAPGPLGSAVLIPEGKNDAWVRATTSSQAIVRNGGLVEVYT